MEFSNYDELLNSLIEENRQLKQQISDMCDMAICMCDDMIEFEDRLNKENK